MRNLRIVLYVLVGAAIIGGYFWSNAAQNRIEAAVDRAREESERLMAQNFARESLFAPTPEATAAGAEPGTAAEPTPTPETGDAVEPELLPIVSFEDATSYYKQIPSEMPPVEPGDLALAEQAAAGQIPEDPAALDAMLERYAPVLRNVELALLQSHASPWDSPLQGHGAAVPNPQIHGLVHRLLVARASRRAATGALDEAVTDLLRAIGYAQDLGRHAPISTRFQFAALETLAARRLLELLTQAPLSAFTLDQTVARLTTLEQIEPAPSQSLRFERLAQTMGLGHAADLLARPGTLDLWSSAFDVRSTHLLADAVERISELLEPAEATLDEPLPQALEPLAALTEQLRSSSNPFLSNLAVDLGSLKLHLTEARRTLRLAQIAAALQRHRLEAQAFPASLDELRGKTLREVPVDPVTESPFVYQPEAGTDGAAQLRADAFEDRLPASDLEISAPAPTPTPVPTPRARRRSNP